MLEIYAINFQAFLHLGFGRSGVIVVLLCFLSRVRIRAREFRIRVRAIARTRGNLCRARDDKDARARPMGRLT